ncbi:hypothetical protein CEXT_355061 [Caerostris extrusa]|uniref:Uncharacterized protein n=1 Tax=Caerostris extrusa TaxID=172846 RepID=A0AAV4MCZ3_CAEEX|nr:hypothetical protein CEXT_355061 [Caerostris extrusa]
MQLLMGDVRCASRDQVILNGRYRICCPALPGQSTLRRYVMFFFARSAYRALDRQCKVCQQRPGQLKCLGKWHLRLRHFLFSQCFDDLLSHELRFLACWGV